MPTKSDNNVEDPRVLFSYLGCSSSEVRTLEALLGEPGGATVLMLQKRLNVPRASIYDHLDTLVAKGLVRKGKKEGGSEYFAESNDVLLSLFTEHAARLVQARGELETYLRTLPDSPSYVPRFSVVEHADAAEHIFRDVLRSREPKTQWFWPVKDMLNTIPDHVFRSFVEGRVRRNISVQILWPHKQAVKLETYPVLGKDSTHQLLREIRILREPIDTTMTYVIYGNKVAYISSRRENYGFIIDSEELAHVTKSQFQFLWNTAMPYGTWKRGCK